MVEIVAIDRNTLPKAWPMLEGFIQMALDKANGEMLIKDVYNNVKDDKYVLLAIFDKEPIAAITLEIQDYPRKRKLGIVHVGGKRISEWFDMAWKTVRQIATDINAESITWTGRYGWERFMKNEDCKGYFIGECEL